MDLPFKLKVAFEALERLLKLIAGETQHSDIVLVGSLSVLGALKQHHEKLSPNAIDALCLSNDFDLFLKNDPSRIDEINRLFGTGSVYNRQTGYFAEAVSPGVANLPSGWQSRMSRHVLTKEKQLTCHFLEPHDAAASKLCRGAENDLRWVTAAIQNGLVDPDTLEQRISKLSFADEKTCARNHLRDLLRSAGWPPLSIDFDWKNGETSAVGNRNDLEAHIQFTYINGRPAYTVEIFKIDGEYGSELLLQTLFDTLEAAEEFVGNVEMDSHDSPSPV